ncbi:hypothetical protein [Flavobacterium sp.]|uniref:hypothetical protein n=1 Tax=Flavobacterium sp. TaxID=239 RepID=UPI00374DD3FA
MKKIVLIVALTCSALVTSCNKKVDASTEVQMADEEQIAPKVVDSIETDTVAPMAEPKDSISK